MGFFNSQPFKTWLLKRKRKNAGVSASKPNADNETSSSSSSEPKSHQQGRLDRPPAAQIQHSSRLLTLPAEIRNSIYEYALLEAGVLIVTAGLQQPPLLTACRQTRQETLELWYTRTTFEIVVVDCENTLIKAFANHTGRIRARYLSPSDLPWFNVGCIGAKNWANLVDWCEDTFDGHGSFMGMNRSGTPMATVVSVAQNTVLNAREYSS
ncbi:hypothetical protein LTR37_001908 [Vermiconidia calcicola]|uniref:Uncharacterized protein n=1 Tax=Vermiconidia calcicola TaxID=1690605 RepID=A0ACC3NVU8_9PEZI|nr:hypothetical protein LTR37_001908 [Vermiconidia calcicola]